MNTKKVYVHQGVVVAIIHVAAPNAIITPGDGVAGAQCYEVPVDQVVEIGWQYVEESHLPAFIAPAVPPTVGPNQFYFLWTMTEQIAIEEIRQVDPVVKLFMRRLDDPRTTEVVLADPAVQAAVRHTVDQLVQAKVIKPEDADNRAAAIIAGGI